MHYGQLLPADQKRCQNAAGVTEHNSLREIHPHLCNVYQMKTLNGISMTLYTYLPNEF